jgi:DNA polymerase III epsilon subunit-like protein
MDEVDRPEGKRRKVVEGADERGEFLVQLRLEECQKKQISLPDVQNLLMWILGIGPCSPWYLTENLHQLRSIAIVFIDGLNDYVFQEYKTDAPFLRSIREQCMISVPRWLMRPPVPLCDHLLHCSKRKEKKKKVGEGKEVERSEQHKQPPSSFASKYAYGSVSGVLHRARKEHSLLSDEDSVDVSGGDKSKANDGQDQARKAMEKFVLSEKELEDNGYPLIGIEKDYLDGRTRTIPGREMNGDLKSEEKDVISWILGLDCEMVQTKNGLELARLSVIDWEDRRLLDCIVQPSNPVLDYLTPYSGITQEILEHSEDKLESARDKLISLMGPHTILCGHSLENDLNALQLIWNRCVDVSILYPHPGGPPMKSSLKYLTKKYLDREIQAGSHDSVEDAQAAMDLIRLKVERGPEFGIPAKSSKTHVFSVMQEEGKEFKGEIVGAAEVIREHAVGPVSAIPSSSDEDVLSRLGRSHASKHTLPFVAGERGVDKILIQVGALTYIPEMYETLEFRSSSQFDVLKKLNLSSWMKKVDSGLKSLHAALPSGESLLMVVGGDGIYPASKLAHAIRKKCQNGGLACWAGEEDAWFHLISSFSTTGRLFICES